MIVYAHWKFTVFGMWQWPMVLYIICADHAPGAKFGHASGIGSLHRLIIGNHSNINISKTNRRILVKLHIQRVALFFLFFFFFFFFFFLCFRLELWRHIRFNGKKIFSETTRPIALMFGMWQWLMAYAPQHKLCHSCPWPRPGGR